MPRISPLLYGMVALWWLASSQIVSGIAPARRLWSHHPPTTRRLGPSGPTITMYDKDDRPGGTSLPIAMYQVGFL